MFDLVGAAQESSTRRGSRVEGGTLAYLLDKRGNQIDLGLQGLTLGRDEANDVVMPDDMQVSRVHAKIAQRNGQWLLVDLRSRNGSFVNTRPIHEHPLRDGDQLCFGSQVFSFISGLDPRATETASSVEFLDPKLTERERSVLQLVSDGLTDKEIAARLGISVNTVRSHLDRIAGKTGLRKRSELTRLAIDLNSGGR
jgi:DNA-binding CsgD family transcriptional regulator